MKLKAMKKGKGDFYGTNYNQIQSEYLDEKTRARIYRSWLEKGEQDGERCNYISEALRKVEERIAENERVKTKVKHSSEVAPVEHGHFVYDGPRFAGGIDWWHCSNCGKLASGVEIFFNYCPYCGVKMDKRRTFND